MAQSINSNLGALTVQRHLARTQGELTVSLQRLSSGLRINSAADDAAGLAISERMSTRIRGLNQSARNANDGISMLQVAEGALGSISGNLQRARELAVQAANATNSGADKAALQQEVAQLVAEIDRIGTTSQFNGQSVFNQSGASVIGDLNQVAVMTGLTTGGWLRNSEQMVQQYFGLQGDGAAMSIELTTFTDGAGGTAARVVSQVGASPAKGTNLQLQIDMADFTPPNLPDGGNAPFYNDRIIAHEMVHAIMARSMNWAGLQSHTWFLEGAAEFIHGADERVAADLAAAGGAGNEQDIVNEVGNGWGGTSADYSGAYTAVRYLHARIKAAGGEGIKDVMTYLTNNQSATLDQAFANAVATQGGAVAGYTSAANFLADFNTNGAPFIAGMNLGNADTGAVGGADADGGAVKTATSVVANGGGSSDALSTFAETFEAIATGNAPQTTLAMQIGADAGQTLDVRVGAANAAALDLLTADIALDASTAIGRMDRALEYINAERARLGAQLNRLTATADNLAVASENLSASRSRIADTDYASETARLSRAQVLQSAASAMVAQANVSGAEVLALLR